MEPKGMILLIEDNEALNIANTRALKLRGYEVIAALTLQAARANLAMHKPDIILLDVMMPDGDGFDFCSEIRDQTAAHILFLTAKIEHENTVRGFLTGGDDYITKPFHPEELLARIDAVMRRRNMDQVSVQMLIKGSLKLEVTSSQAYWSGKTLGLTPKEFAVLLLLAQNEGKTIRAEQVYESVWKAPLSDDRNALQAVLSKLRKKLEITDYTVATMRGQGYTFWQND